MKRINERATDALTLVHKFVGVAWLVAALATLLFVVPGGDIAWERVTLFGRIASAASVVTLVLGFDYALFTVWGFLGSRWLVAKWALYLVAVASSGYAIRATREQDGGLVITLAVLQVVMLAAAMGLGVYLERSRHAGRLPRGTE